MTDYRRIYIPGATWFFTVNLVERKNNRLLVDHIDVLRQAFVNIQAFSVLSCAAYIRLTGVAKALF